MIKYLVFLIVIALAGPVFGNEDSGVEVLSTFTSPMDGVDTESFEEVRFQHEILFYMGIVLLIAIFITAGLGIAMVFLGKQVFIAHMISAGVVVFLAVAHAVAAVVWFFPFK